MQWLKHTRFRAATKCVMHFNRVGRSHHPREGRITAVVACSWVLSEMEAVRAILMHGLTAILCESSGNHPMQDRERAGLLEMPLWDCSSVSNDSSRTAGIPTALTDPNWGFQKTLFGGSSLRLPRPFQTWVMESIFFKLIPAEGHGISAVEAALQLTKLMVANGLNPAHDIARIKVRTHEAACRIIDKRGPLSNAADRDHCMRYMLAVVFWRGQWSKRQTIAILAHGLRIIELTPCVTRSILRRTNSSPTTIRSFQKSAASGLTIMLTNGSKLGEIVVEHPIGHPEREDTIPAVKPKHGKTLA